MVLKRLSSNLLSTKAKNWGSASFLTNMRPHLGAKQFGIDVTRFSGTVPASFIRAYQVSYIKYNNNKPLPSSKSEFTKEKFNVTKSKLLAQATGPLSRLLIHIKWPLKRNAKPFSIDDASAIFSWLVMGNVLWIILGTTTFGLVLVYSIHTFDSLRSQVSAYFSDDRDSTDLKKDDSFVGSLTSSILSYGLGINIDFHRQSVLPEFKDGKLIFKNVGINSIVDESSNIWFNCDVESLSLSLSFGKWSDGHGLIQDLEIFGANGKVYKNYDPVTQTNDVPPATIFRRYHDTNHFQFDENDLAQEIIQSEKTSIVDPNYELSGVKVHDSYFEVYDSRNPDKPLKISIFNCELPKLTGKTMLIDFFNANTVNGSINDSMFTIHKKQDYNQLPDENIIRFKLDGIDLGNFSQAYPQLKFNWILNGKAEILADIRFPSKEFKENTLFELEYKKISESINKIIYDLTSVNGEPYQPQEDAPKGDETKLMKGALQAIYQTFNMNNENRIYNNENNQEYVIIDAKVKFHNLQATLPKELPLASTGNIPFLTLHDLRSLVAYINKLDADDRPPITVKTTVIERLSELHNIDNLTQARVFDLIVSDIYEEFMKMVQLDEKHIIDQKSSMWSHSIASQLLLLGLGVIV